MKTASKDWIDPRDICTWLVYERYHEMYIFSQMLEDFMNVLIEGIERYNLDLPIEKTLCGIRVT